MDSGVSSLTTFFNFGLDLRETDTEDRLAPTYIHYTKSCKIVILVCKIYTVLWSMALYVIQ